MNLPRDKQLIRVKNLLSMLGRGKWELSGDEVLAFAQTIEYVLELERNLKEGPKPTEMKEPVKQPMKARKKTKKDNVNAI